MIYIESPSVNPYFNLALEQYVFDCMDRNQVYFMLWQNENTIVVGKHQNTIAEINQEFVEENGISVVRRLSGGGAVYHDMGNLNFTFVVSENNQMSDFDFKVFCQPVVNALQKFGVDAEVNGRNNITVAGKKISGNSQYAKQGRIMHHGSILYHSDLEKVIQSLKVSKDKIASKGISSVRSRVTNVKEYMKEEISLEDFKKALLEEMFGQQEMEQYQLTQEDIEKIELLEKERYNTWEWNYGYSPAYNIVKERYVEGRGKIEVHLDVENGIIQKFDVFGDYFGNGDKEELQKILKGTPLIKEELQSCLKEVSIEKYFHQMDKDIFIQLLLD